MSYEVAIIGTGSDPSKRTRDGFSMGYRHAGAYAEHPDCSITACADVSRENADRFANTFNISDDGVFEHHSELIANATPDIVSVCVPPSAHADIVLDCAQAASIQAIHCEKPMAPTWSDCQEMVETCEQAGVQLTIDHQRRFSKPVVNAAALIDDGAIGDLRRMEWSEVNLFDAGSHLFDLCDHFVSGSDPTWVLAAVDATVDRRWFGTRNSDQAIAHWEYENGVQGLASTSDGDHGTAIDPYLRLVGTDGEIEIDPPTDAALRMRTDGGWKTIDTNGEALYGPSPSLVDSALAKVASVAPVIDSPGLKRLNYARAIDHVVESLQSGTDPIISGRAALRSAQLIFGCWESARQGQRISFPLELTDDPLAELATRAASETTHA